MVIMAKTVQEFRPWAPHSVFSESSFILIFYIYWASIGLPLRREIITLDDYCLSCQLIKEEEITDFLS